MSSTPTHILYIAEFSTGGSVESLLCLVSGLDKSMFRATVLFYSMPDENVSDRFKRAGAAVHSLYPRATGHGGPKDLGKLGMQAKVRRIFGPRIERFYESLKYGLYFFRFRMPIYKAIRKQIEAIEPDLVHLNNGVDTDMPGILAARMCGVPAVCHIRTLARLTHVSVAASQSVRAFICISNAVRETAVDQGVNPERCVVVPNAVDLDRFKPTDNCKSNVRAEFAWGKSHNVFSLVGRVVSWKGQDYFIRAIAEAYKSDDSVRALVVGDGGEQTDTNDSYFAGLRTLVSELGLEEIVRFTGHRTDIPEVMRSSDVVVCASSLPEPFGRVIIESMALGTTVIATDAGGARDIIDNDVNGLLVPVKDSHAMAQAMLRLCEDRKLKERLRMTAAESVKRLYGIEKHVEKLAGIYRSILKST